MTNEQQELLRHQSEGMRAISREELAKRQSEAVQWARNVGMPHDSYRGIQNTVVTTAQGHDIQAGDWITITVRDTRWWRRVSHWMLRRPGYPQRSIKRRVSQVSATTLTL